MPHNVLRPRSLGRISNDVKHLVEKLADLLRVRLRSKFERDHVEPVDCVLGRRLTNSSSTTCPKRPSPEPHSGNAALMSVSLRLTSCWRRESTRCALSNSLR